MNSSRGPRPRTAPLRFESLEDRSVPAVYNPALPVNEQVASGAVMGDRVTVILAPGTSSAVLAAGQYTSSVQWLGFNDYSVRLQPGTDLATAIAYYGTLAGVASSEPDPIAHLDRIPNDAMYGSMYGPGKIAAPTVWTQTTGDPGFVVGVIDSGIDYTHPDLVGNLWTNPGETPNDGIDNDSNGYIDDFYGWDFENNDNDPFDDDSHGTHVSGTIGASGNDGVGITGINWGVRIMGLKALGPSGGAYSSIIAAINYSVSMGVKVTNNSYGGGGTTTAFTQAMARVKASGQIFVAAAGNDIENNDVVSSYPANYTTMFDNVITVAATDDNDRLAAFSNYGATSVTLGAPGVHILSTTPYGTYSFFDGTSMASPHVAGAISLYWSANPTLTYQQVIAKLLSSVDPVPQLAGLVSTGGRLNVANMFGLSTVPPIVVGAPVGTEVVRVLDVGGATKATINPYPGFLGGVAAASGDVNGDGVADVITAATLGGHVKVFDGASGAEIRSFYGFEGYQGPINLAVGDLTGDGIGDLIVAANLNGHVKVFDGQTGELTFSSLLYQGYAGSVAVSTADTNGDGGDELVTAADGNAGVHIKTFAADSMTLSNSFLATPPNDVPGSGFSVSAGDLDGDNIAELLVSQGARVRVLNSQTRAVRADFMAFDPLSKAPVTVQAGQYSGGAKAELIVIRQTQGQSHLKVFTGQDFTLTDSFYAGTR